MSSATAALPDAHTTASPSPSSPVGRLGWLASGAGLLAMSGTLLLPWLVAVVIAAIATAIGVAVLVPALAERGRGIGHGIAGVVTSLVALLVAAGSAAVPEFDMALIGGSSSSSDTVVLPPPDVPFETETFPPEGQPEVVLLSPVDVVASGTAPDSQDPTGDVVRFDPVHAVDGDPTTAWRVPGNGVGEYLILTFGEPVHVEFIAMIPGYAKVDPIDGTDRFWQNRRVSSAQFLFSDGQSMGFTYADEPEPQIADIGLETSQVTMQITGTTAAQRDFTAVSELQVYGWALE